MAPKNRSGWKKRDYSRQFFPPLLSLEIDLWSSGMRGGMVNEASQVALLVKNPPSNAGGIGDSGSISGSGRSPGEGNSNPLQYSCLENPIDREAWQVTVHWVAKSWTRLSTSMEFLAHLLGCRHWSKGFICAKWLH